jgi:hypothetical protein
MPPWPIRLLAAVAETMHTDGLLAYRTVPLKVLFACEHLWLVRQGMICSYSSPDETLADLLKSL